MSTILVCLFQFYANLRYKVNACHLFCEVTVSSFQLPIVPLLGEIMNTSLAPKVNISVTDRTIKEIFSHCGSEGTVSFSVTDFIPLAMVQSYQRLKKFFCYRLCCAIVTPPPQRKKKIEVEEKKWSVE